MDKYAPLMTNRESYEVRLSFNYRGDVSFNGEYGFEHISKFS